MHRYMKKAGLALAVVAIAAGLSACKQDNEKERDGTAGQSTQQQSRSDLKSGFGGAAGTPSDTMDEAAAPADEAGGTLDDIATETAKAAEPPEAPALDAAPEVTGSVTRAEEVPADDAGAPMAIPGTSGDDMAGGMPDQLSEDEKFAAELAREAEREEADTLAARKGESR